MGKLTTHVLNVAAGTPAAGMRVELRCLSEAPSPPPRDLQTDADGRCRDLAEDAVSSLYRLTFDVATYFGRKGRTSIYPEIAITFTCGSDMHYHLPLLLSDNSYTTYRGS